MGDTIAKASKRTGLSKYTLWYCGKEGLLPSIGRDSSGCRSFQENGYEWIEVISCLKNTGMTVKEIHQFIDWCKEGDSTLQKRLELFLERRCRAEQQIHELEQHIEKIEKKIRFYETAVEAGAAVIHSGKSCDDCNQTTLFNGSSRMVICHISAQPIYEVGFMQSIQRETSDFRERPVLSGGIATPVAIIDDGLAGILTAYLLRQKETESVVLEANRIGSEQAQNIAAKITSQYNLIYTKLSQNFSEEKAKQYTSANQQTIGRHRQTITQEQINCQFEERPAYLYSVNREDIPALEVEVEYACQAGIHAKLTKKTTLPFEIAAAIQFGRQAQFHPLKFLQATSEPLTMYEKTKVLSVEGKSIITDCGTVTAKHTIFVSHSPFVNVPGYYFMRMHQGRSYTLALQNAAELDDTYPGIGEKDLPMRSYGDTLLLGRGDHRTDESKTGGKYDMLREVAALLYPQGEELAHWPAQDCMTLDSAPCIGQFSSSTPNQYVAIGFGKWGVTNNMIFAVLLSDQVAGDENPSAPMFSPSRFTPGTSAKNFLSGIGRAMKGLAKQTFSLPDADSAKPKTLLDSHDGIVITSGKKAGVYKEKQGGVTAVSIKCPHLGCQLERNPDEKSWDCPCHDSCFDTEGGLLEGPARTDLEEIPT